jgi:hydroxyacylglutathione hydrolase
MRFPHCNGFLLVGKETLLVDAGIGDARIRELDRCRRIDTLLISHSHPDHILSWQTLADRRLLLPDETPDSVHDLLALGTRFTGSTAGGAHWVRRMRENHGLTPLRPPDHRYGHGDRIGVGGGPVLEAISAPGHLRDHYCFLEITTGTLLTTDVDLSGFGPWYGNPEADLDRFESDIRSLAAMAARQVCSAHKPPVSTGLQAAFHAYLDALDRQFSTVLNLCRSPISLAKLVEASPFYGNRFPDLTAQRIYESQMIEKALARLIRQGRVSMRGDRYLAG